VSDAASQPGRIEWGARVASGAVMVVAAIAAIVGGGLIFGAIIVAGAYAALREWHRLVNGGKFSHEVWPALIAVGIAVWMVWRGYQWPVSVSVVLAGAAAVAAMAASRKTYVFWHAAGVLYIGLPVLALMELRVSPIGGGIVVGGLFAAIWASDTGALVAGKLIGGPKLAPGLSPQKTWSGFIGGLAAAALALAIYSACVGGTALPAALMGICLSFAGHCGDLFESWVKRQYRAKNMGALIPGHGGMLDRIDSLLFAAPAAALLLFVIGFDPLLDMAP
jgi:phosphatidate cytidylyltransferase